MNLTADQREHLERIAACAPSLATIDSWAGNGCLARLATGDLDRARVGLRTAIHACMPGARVDCVDFRLNLLLRAWHCFPEAWTPDLREAFREAALASRYYGCFSAEYPAFRNSENHHLSWAVAEHLVAGAFPGETFLSDGRAAALHDARGRFLIANWIDQRARFGFCEWNSASYMGVNLMSLLNVVDFSADPSLRRMASLAISMVLADLAADSHHGFVIGAQARLYPRDLSRDTQFVAPAMALLARARDPGSLRGEPGLGEFAATTTWRPPDWLSGLADPSLAQVNRERHRVETDLFYSCRSVFWRPPRELWDEEARRKFAPGSLFDVAIHTERTHDYLLSCAIFSKQAMADPSRFHQALPWAGCLDGEVPILVTHPISGGPHGSTEERAWTGTASVPTCHAGDGVAAAVYGGTTGGEDFTHAHFPTTQLAEWHQEGSRFHGRRGNACIALLAPPEARLSVEGPWAGKEILAPGRAAAWLMAFGSISGKDAFSDFIERCRHISVRHLPQTGRAEITLPSARWELVPHGEVLVDGAPFAFEHWARLDNPVVHADFGASRMKAVHRDGSAETLDFGEARELVRNSEFARAAD